MELPELRTVLEQLRAAVLPSIPETEPMDEDMKIGVRAYVVLAHAEIESYIENRCKKHVEAIRDSIAAGDAIHPSLLALAITFAGEITSQHTGTRDALSLAKTCYGLYTSKYVNQNNGIRASHLERLVSPFGIVSDDLRAGCGPLIDALEDLASLRGEHAHVSGSLTREVYPSNALEPVVEILSQMPTLEAALAI